MIEDIGRLKKEVERISAKIKELEAQAGKKSSLLSTPKEGESWNVVLGSPYSGFSRDRGTTRYPENLSLAAMAENYAHDYAKAFNTFFALRHCEGSQPAVAGQPQYFITSSGECNICATAVAHRLIFKLDFNTVWFSTEEYARRAIEKIGESNILHMMKVFSGIFE